MKKLVALFTIAASLTGAVAFAGQTPKTAPKTTDLWTCPMTGEKIADHKGAGTPAVVGKYTVHFCCGGCDTSFAKLSAKEKAAKVAAIAKKEAPAPAKKS
jgi:hypothetical protein